MPAATVRRVRVLVGLMSVMGTRHRRSAPDT
jgi:hypothetical protein